MKPRHIVVLALFVLINGLIISALMGGKGKKEEDSEKKVYIPHLEAAEVENVEEQFDLSTYGTVSSFKAVDISCEVQGKLIEGKKIKPGIKFKKGELLFNVNDIEARYNLRSRKSSFINLIANILPDIKVDYSSEYGKWDDYLASIKLNQSLPVLPAWKTDREKVFLSTRNILTEYFAIKSLEEQLNKFYVYAPFNGMITDVFLTDFAVVNPGAKVMRIVETGNYEIPTAVPVSRMDLVGVGSPAKIFSTSGAYRGEGEIVRISEVIDKNTQSVNVYVKPIISDSVRYIEGEYVEVRLKEEGAYQGMRLPHSAIRKGEVLLYSKKDSTISSKPVSVLDENEHGVFVSGLKDKQIVITQEVSSYTDSTKYGIVLR